MWKEASSLNRRVANIIIGESEGCRLKAQASWWWVGIQKLTKEK